jgi:hypothetical protein
MISLNSNPYPFLVGSIGSMPGAMPVGFPMMLQSTQQSSKNKDPDYDFSFSGLTKSNIQYLKTKTSALSDIYNMIFTIICNNKNKNDDEILRNVRAKIKSSYTDYLKEFCIGDNPMHLPPNIQPNVTISDACIGYIPEIVHMAIYLIRRLPAPPGPDFSIACINNYIAPRIPTLSLHEIEFLTGVIHGSISMALRSTDGAPGNHNAYNGHYGAHLVSLNAYNNIAQVIIPQVMFVGAIAGIPHEGANPAPGPVNQGAYVAAIPNIETQLDIQAKTVANMYANITSKIITIGITIGYLSVAQGYASLLQTDNAATYALYNGPGLIALRNGASPPIIATARRSTTNLINAIFPPQPPQPNQPGNCIIPMFSDEKLKNIIKSIRKDTSTKLAAVCSREIKIDIQFGGNHNGNHPFIDVLKLLQDKTDKTDDSYKQEYVCRQSGHGYYCELQNSNKKCDLCIKWSRDRKLFREVLIEMLNSNDFLSNKTLDMMNNSVSLLPANLLDQDQYIKFNQSLIDYKEMKRQNRINHGFN